MSFRALVLTQGADRKVSGAIETLDESRLPAGGQATPMTYRSEQSGRQFVVVVAGGHGSLGTRAGDSIIAYALPR